MATLQDALTAYRICAKAEGKSAKTIGWTTDAVGYFADFLGGEGIELETIDAQSLRRFILALQAKPAFSSHRFTRPSNRPLSPETVASYTRAIKGFFSFLEREGIILSNPMAKVKLPKTPKKVMPTFSEQEIGKLLSQPNKKSDEGFRDYAIMATLLDCGIRVSELCGLTISDVDLENGYLRVMCKGAKERRVPIGYTLTKVLLKYKVAHRPASSSMSFFLTRDGRPIARKRVQVMIKKYGARVGIQTRCSPHTFRSTSAVSYLRHGGDAFSLQRKLGHATLAMTRRYCELSDSDVRARHLASSPLDKLTS